MVQCLGKTYFSSNNMNPLEEDILKRLVEVGDVTSAQLKNIQAKIDAGASLNNIVLEDQLVDEEKYTKVVAQAMNLPYVDLRKIQIPRDVLTIIPESTAREHAIVAFEEVAEILRLAMVNPADRQIVEFIHKKVDKPVEISLVSSASLQTALAQYRRSLDLELQEILKVTQLPTTPDVNASKAAEDLPVIRIVDLILKHAILQDVSDIHIEPTEDVVIIRYRLDGLLHDAMTLQRAFLAGIVARIKVLSNLKIDEHRLPQDGRFKVETKEYNIAFRVSILPVFDGEKVVMRLLDESGRGLDLSSIGIRETPLKIFRQSIQRPNGMILVTGPTGSGKTTTLYAAMKELNTPDVNISTVEDPIEYRMPRINQTQVHTQIGLTFSNGLRSLVRQDPDILMVGEIRDEETASLAVNAALTGHLVLSTLHTNSAAGALPRLLDMGVEAFLVASTINLLVAQRLVRRLCEECRQPTKFDKNIIKELDEVLDSNLLLKTMKREKAVPENTTWTDLTLYKAGQCEACTDGYKGRLGIYEMLEFTEKIRAIVTPSTSSDDLENAAREQQQMVTMIEDGLIKVVQGITSIEEVMRVAQE